VLYIGALEIVVNEFIRTKSSDFYHLLTVERMGRCDLWSSGQKEPVHNTKECAAVHTFLCSRAHILVQPCTDSCATGAARALIFLSRVSLDMDGHHTSQLLSAS
jgi:hypothetical protein